MRAYLVTLFFLVMSAMMVKAADLALVEGSVFWLTLSALGFVMLVAHAHELNIASPR